MVSESCYVTLMENAILLCVAYGLLSAYFDDVMHSGFLFFAVFIGLCACYASTAAAFCMMLLDDTTSTQLLLLDAERMFNKDTPPPNNVAHVARILARAATASSVALFLLFLTVGCEFFTEDSPANSLTDVALRRKFGEAVIATQFAVSTAFAVYFMLLLLVLGSNQQLNGLFLRLQYMTQKLPMPEEQAKAFTTTVDDVALFVRALLGMYVVVCGCTGTFQELFFLIRAPEVNDEEKNLYTPQMFIDFGAWFSSLLKSLKTALGGEYRNYVALVFWAWCLLTDTLRAVLPAHWISAVVLAVPDLLHGGLCAVLAEVLFRDRSLTNFACAVLLICDATCVLCACVGNVVEELRKLSKKDNSDVPETKKKATLTEQVVLAARPPVVQDLPDLTPKLDLHRAMSSGAGLCFSEAHFNIDNIKMRVFEKKSN